ncbi:MAG: hypothetical protein KDA44_15980 [Planctomycetales bacterium]|nr:hypothetical protein [Planctomycetales bacterium]
MAPDPNRENPTADSPPARPEQRSLRMRRALLLSLLLAAAAAILTYWFGGPPRYRAACLFRVHLKRDFLVFPPDSSEDESARFVALQIELIRSPLVLSPVAQDAAVGRHLVTLGVNEPLEWLSRSVQAGLVGESELLEIACESPNAEAAKDIVEAVADSYMLAYQEDTDQYRRNVIKLLEEEKNRAAQQVDRRREDVRMQSELTTGVNPFVVGGADQAQAEIDNYRRSEKQLKKALLYLGIALDSARSGLHRMALRHGLKDEEFTPTPEQIENYVAHDYAAVELTRQIRKEFQTLKRPDADDAPTAGRLEGTLWDDVAHLKRQLSAARQVAEQNAGEDLQFDHWRELLMEQSTTPDEEPLDQDPTTTPPDRQTTIAAELETIEANGDEQERPAALEQPEQAIAKPEPKEELIQLLQRERETARHRQSLGRMEAFDAAVALVWQLRDNYDACQRALTDVKSSLRDLEELHGRRVVTLDLEFAERELEREMGVHQRIADRFLALRTEERAPSRISRRNGDAIVTKQDDAGALSRRMAIASLTAFCVPLAVLLGGRMLGGRQTPRRQNPFGSDVA